MEIVELQNIKLALPHGSLKRIQKKAGVSRLTVFKFFNGKSKNQDVLNAVIAEHNEYLGKLAELKECAPQKG